MATLKYKKEYSMMGHRESNYNREEIPFLEDYDIIKYLLKEMYRSNILIDYKMTDIKINFDVVIVIECWFERK